MALTHRERFENLHGSERELLVFDGERFRIKDPNSNMYARGDRVTFDFYDDKDFNGISLRFGDTMTTSEHVPPHVARRLSVILAREADHIDRQ